VLTTFLRGEKIFENAEFADPCGRLLRGVNRRGAEGR